MAQLNLEFIGFKDMYGNISVDGKIVKLKRRRNKSKTYYCECETNAKKCEVIIYKSHYYSSKYWFWWNALYFIISLFGILDLKQNKKCLVQDCKFIMDVDGDCQALITRQDYVDGGKLVNIETDRNVEEISNVQYYDKEAKLKQAKMKKAKIGITIAIVLVVALLAFL